MPRLTSRRGLGERDGLAETTLVRDRSQQTNRPDKELSALVLSESFMGTYPLAGEAELTIGRTSSADIYIDDPSVSRRHAVLQLGAEPVIRDLGSSNGTTVRGERIAPNEPVSLAVGEPIILGSATLLLQRRLHGELFSRRFWAPEHLEARLEEECARGTRSEKPFTLAHLRMGAASSGVELRQILAQLLRASDVIGEIDRAEYQILLVDSDPAGARRVMQRIERALEERGTSASVGIAHFPTDGQSASALLARAQSTIGGSSVPRAQSPGTRDPAMQELIALADRIAAGEISVLILGETGVGKEVLAEEIHRRSARASGPFLRLNCAALSEPLLESELFGHERGAFTHAVAAKPGLLETADGGTVFLDEIGELPLNLQVKLLRVIEEKRVLRVGAIKPRRLDVRFVAATNRDLESLVEHGLFRADLYYRLAAATLKIPPLRERPADIEPLARQFLDAASCHLGRIPSLTDDAVELLRRHPWPGNIRELRNVVERAVLLCGDGPIAPTHLPVGRMRDQATRSVRTQGPPSASRAAPVDTTRESDDERSHVLAVLAASGGNQSRTARELGISRGALIRRLERWGVARPRKSS